MPLFWKEWPDGKGDKHHYSSYKGLFLRVESPAPATWAGGTPVLDSALWKFYIAGDEDTGSSLLSGTGYASAEESKAMAEAALVGWLRACLNDLQGEK